MYEDYLALRGRGWVAELEGKVVGFCYADAADASIWALFIAPAYEGRGIARALLGKAVAWLFGQGHAAVRLSTGMGTGGTLLPRPGLGAGSGRWQGCTLRAGARAGNPVGVRKRAFSAQDWFAIVGGPGRLESPCRCDHCFPAQGQGSAGPGPRNAGVRLGLAQCFGQPYRQADGDTCRQGAD
jgi:GNAT superfamily N-acetyltransferase